MTVGIVYDFPTGMRNEITTPVSWGAILNDYTGWQRASHVPSTTTKLRSYHLRRFALTTGLAPREVTVDDLIAHLARPGWSAGTIRSVRTTMRSFFRWARVSGRLPADPAESLPPVRVQPGKPRPASEAAVQRGLQDVDERVRLMVELGTRGLRCCEIALVESRDVLGVRGERSLLVHGKGGKERLVPISDHLAERLVIRAGFAFPGQIDGHLSAGYVSKLISRAMAGLSTAHPLRHRFATRALRASGGNLRVVQELLGHASVATTQIYTLVEDDELRKAALAA